MFAPYFYKIVILSPFIYIIKKIYNLFDIYGIIKDNYIYNLSWEDSDVDKELYKLKKGNKICMITTGGDNVINYLLEDPESIHTFDLNKHQNYLLEMKIACIKVLTQEECFQLFAKSNYTILEDNFDKILIEMSPNASNWWMDNKYIMKNFLYSGSVKYVAYLFKIIFWIFGCDDFFKNIKDNPGIENQRIQYKKYKNKFDNMSYYVEKFKYYMISWVGVPLRQIEMDNDPKYFSKVCFHLCNNTDLINDNYFYRGYIYDEWTEQCCPKYLKKEYFELIKSRLNRINIVTGLIHEEIINNHAKDKFDRVILLDHMDWLNEKQIREEWLSLKKYTTPDCLFCWRSYSKTQPFGCLSNLEYIHSETIDKINGDEPIDRVGMYNSVHVAKIIDNSLYNVKIPKYNLTFYNFIKTFSKLCLSPFVNKNDSNFLDNFYKNQANDYDAYRYYMLHGKKELMTSLPFKKGNSLLLFAGGTGDVLDYLKDNINLFEKITIMDICESLLNKAKKKKKRYNWDNVEIIKGNAHNFISDNKYDIVLITYSLTMIPDWKKAIDNSISCLKENGYIGVSDFTTTCYKSTIIKKFWKKIFSFDNVFINDEHFDYLNNRLKTIFYREEYGGFPYIPLIKTGHYSALFKKDN